MNVRKLVFELFLLLTILTINISVLGCDNINLADATLSEATMCKSVDPKTMAPIGKTDIFPPDFKEMHCNVLVSNAPAKTVIKAQFFNKAKSMIAESELEVKGTAYANFSWVRGTELWEEGDYSVILYLNGKEKITVKYKIQGQVIVGVPQFTEVITCKAVDSKTGKPMDTTTVFPADFKTIYLSVKVNNATPDTEIKVRWFKADGTLLIAENVAKFTGTGYLVFALDRTGDPWAAGDYIAALFMNGIGDIIAPFSIQ